MSAPELRKRSFVGVGNVVLLVVIAFCCCILLSHEKVAMRQHEAKIVYQEKDAHRVMTLKASTQESLEEIERVTQKAAIKALKKKGVAASSNNQTKVPKYRLPTVQLIGVPKCGTTSLAHWLQRKFSKASVFEGEPEYYNKEVHFFDKDARFEQGLDFYAKRFDYNRSRVSKHGYLDATPNTFSRPKRVRDIYDEAGGNQRENLKIIVILRDPISRELSWYNHLANGLRSGERGFYTLARNKENNKVMTFDEFVQQVSVPTLQSGGLSNYALHLSQWFEHFDRQQILVLSYDEVKKNPKNLEDRVRKFLGMPGIPGTMKHANAQQSPQKIKSDTISNTTRAALSTVLEPLNEKLYQLLDDNPGPIMEQRPFPRFE